MPIVLLCAFCAFCGHFLLSPLPSVFSWRCMDPTECREESPSREGRKARKGWID